MKRNFGILKRYFGVFALVLIMPGAGARAQDSTRLASPDGRLVFSMEVSSVGELHYQVTYQGRPVVEPSRLGVQGWEKGLNLRQVITSAQDTVWKPVYGERSRIRDAYHRKLFIFDKGQLEVRAYDAGIAFRYVFPEDPAGSREIGVGHELTNFVLPAGTLAWFTDHAQGEYRLLPLQNWPGEAERPLTLQLQNGLYATLGEAEVVDYCRTKFVLDPARPNTIACSMYDRVDLSTPFATPWRLVMVADKPTQLLEHDDLYLNLNKPCQIARTEWIKPGKIIREMTLSTSGAKELVDFAVKRHLQYIHFDAGWYGYEYADSSDASAVHVDPRRNPRNDLDLPEVIRYAKANGIGVFLYVNQLALAKDLDRLLPLYEKWGVAGIKFGFVHVGSFRWTVWLHEAVKKCAQHHLLVDIHDEYRPTGFSRTYPNLLNVEGVRGNEEMPDATHNTVLPFTRFLCGPADYTICYYHRPELKPRLAATQNLHVLKTTSMHQMALSVVYYSPLEFLYWYDSPADSKDEPELEFFDHVPTVWDDTKVLDGEIGKFITVARRSGREWFVGSITNDDPRDIDINLAFLEPGHKYKATIYYDDPKSPVRTKVSMKTMIVDCSTGLPAHLLASGGQTIWIRPLPGAQKRFYVAKNGNDANNGSSGKPFSTLEKARNAVRDFVRDHPFDSVTVLLRQGEYAVKRSLLFDSLDAGHCDAPVVYTAFPGERVVLSGGVSVPLSKAVPVRDKAILARLPPEASAKVLAVDLKSLGIIDYGTLRPKGFGRPYTPAGMELFCNEEAMQLARWPNDSLVPIGKVLDPGSIPRNGDQTHRGGTFRYGVDRPSRWALAKDFWISGLFHFGYADDAVAVAKLDTSARTLTSAQETMYGFQGGKDFQRWYAFNLLEEIDRPGEYYIDRGAGILYFYPPDDGLRSIRLSLVETPLIVLNNASHLRFEGLIVECGRSMGIYIESGEDDRIEDCTIRNFGGVGVSIGKGANPAPELWWQGPFEPASEQLGSLNEALYVNTVFNRDAGHDQVVSRCHIYNTGSGGVSLGGGDRLTLQRGNNQVLDCRIHDFNRIDRSYKAGVNIDGVGNSVRHCEIYRCPGSAIYLHGNEHTIEANNIHDAVTDGDDMGAIYYGRNPSELGNRVLHNFIHDIGNGRGIIAAVYHDDGACGMEVVGNIFRKAGSMTVLIGGGDDNVYRDNIFVDCPLAFHLDDRLSNWSKALITPDGLFHTRLQAVHYNEPPYSVLYPTLPGYFADSVGLPRRNVIANNLFLNVGKLHSGKTEWAQWGKNIDMNVGPDFVNRLFLTIASINQ
jgi:alpha-glucosidase